VITKQDVGNDESKDSDVDPNSGKSSTISVKDGNVTAVDIGIYKNLQMKRKFCIGICPALTPPPTPALPPPRPSTVVRELIKYTKQNS